MTACSRRERSSSGWWSRATWTRSPGVSEGFVFPAVGGAVLLSADDSRAGFTAFQFATFPEFADLFQSYVDWQEDARRGSPSRPERPHRRDRRVLRHPGDRVRRVDRPRTGGGQGSTSASVDLLVATASVPGFADGLAKRLGVSAERVASPSDGLAGAHTAAPACGARVGDSKAARTALFVSAGAGITVVAALYRA